MNSKFLIAIVGAASLAGAVSAADTTYTNNDTIVFTNGTASIHGEQMDAPLMATDVFFFDVTDPSMFSGTISTHGLLGSDGVTTVSHLDFTSATLTGSNGFNFSYAVPAPAGDETISLNSLALLAGDYTLSIGYNVTVASMANSASYDGGLHLVTADAASVPEPASWAMMVGGFGLMGGAMRRKKATVSFA